MMRVRFHAFGRGARVAGRYLAPLLVFVAALLFAPVEAQASPTGEVDPGAPGEFATTPIPGVENRPGFKWVEPKGGEPGHYLIYNPIGDPDAGASHEACVGWWYFANYSRSHDFENYLIRLDSDLDFSEFNFNRGNGGRAQLAVGNADCMFQGTFDGQDHTISNLDNEREGILAVYDCGFFGQTYHATIKNINFKNCYVGASYRAGLVVGFAQDSFLLNIVCDGCTTSVIPGNNIINLVTNAGIAGGMIAGEAQGTTLYNCEMRGGKVVCNATAGVGALGGQPLYLGGLVGGAKDSVIEYSRVTDTWNEDGSRSYAEVKNAYEVAASVASYSEVFTGGIVGMMCSNQTGTKIVDCFSTAKLHSRACIFFAVGLGLGVTEGYTGGIAGLVRHVGEAGNNEILRTSYAGDLSSYTYNIILLGIPAIEYDKHLGGIVGRGGDNATVTDAYFLRSASATDKTVSAIRTSITGNGHLDGPNFGPRDEQYPVRDSWEGWGFDMAGGEMRNVGYPWAPGPHASEWDNNHYNKWVMDYRRGIPVHGGSIKATLDFPGGGTVSVGQTGLAGEKDVQSTADPYDFAVQGFMAGDDAIELTYEPATAPEKSSWASDARNQGFRFMGWYRSKGVRANDIEEDHTQFTEPSSELNTTATGIIGDAYLVQKAVEGEPGPHKLTVTKPLSDDKPRVGDYADNDLYLAYEQAQVLLHDADGNLVDTSKVAQPSEDTADDWHDYGDAISLPVDVARGQGSSLSDSARLIGWTSMAPKADEYKAATSTVIAKLMDAGLFFEPGSAYTVEAPANLYPVYADYISNVSVVYEGHEQDNNEFLAIRDGYGEAVVRAGDDGVRLAVVPAQNSPLVTGTVRFLGWYEDGIRVSRGEESTRVAAGEECFVHHLGDVDLTKPHTYEARFEYRVDYWYFPYGTSDAAWTHFAQLWKAYKAEFDNLTGPTYRLKAFSHWAPSDAATHGGRDIVECGDASHAVAGPIVAPVSVDAHNEPAGERNHIVVTTDFPAGPVARGEERGADYHAVLDGAPVNDAGSSEKPYWFHGWVGDCNGGLSEWKATSGAFDWNTGHTNSYAAGWEYWIEAHVTARVQFVGAAVDGATLPVARMWNQSVFLPGETVNDYAYHFPGNKGNATGLSSVSAASPADGAMERPGFAFLGWIDVSDPAFTQAERDYVFNGVEVPGIQGPAGFKASSEPGRAIPYLMTRAETCQRPMELWPVYIPVPKIETTSNIALAGVVEGASINIPRDPELSDAWTGGDPFGAYACEYNADGGVLLDGAACPVSVSHDAAGWSTVRLKADTTTKVTPGQSSVAYELTSMVLMGSDGKAVTLVPDAGTDDAFTCRVRAGGTYTFVAVYEPVAVVYHVAPSTTPEHLSIVTRHRGEALGKAPVDGQKVSEAFGKAADLDFLVGWTEQAPTQGAEWVSYAPDVKLVTPKTSVKGAMELWPVFRAADVKVDSNIDDVIAAAGKRPEDFRSVSRSGANGAVLEAKPYPGYRFDGWYVGGKLLNASATHTLAPTSLYAGATFTARYTQVHDVRYHDTDGSVLFTAHVPHDQDRALVQKVMVDDPQSPGQQVERVVPVDLEAFSQIKQELAARSAEPGAAVQASFSTWQLANADGTMTPWNSDDPANFTNQLVKTDMDLYPVTWELAAVKADGTSYTSSLSWSSVTGESGEEKVAVTLRGPFDEALLKVSANVVSYAPAQSGAEARPLPQDGLPVLAFGAGSQEIGGKAAIASGVTGHAGPDPASMPATPGIAYLEFSGNLKVIKATSDPQAAGRVFYMRVSSAIPGGPAVTVPVQVADAPDEHGEYVGSALVSVPYGTYTVSEDLAWSWRYTASVQVRRADAWVDAPTGEVAVASLGFDAQGDPVPIEVRVANERGAGDRDRWFDGESRMRNVFGKPTGGSEA